MSSEESGSGSKSGPSTSSSSPNGGSTDHYEISSEPDEYFTSLFRPSFDDESPIKERIVRLLSIGEVSTSARSGESEFEQNCPQFFDMFSFAEYFVADIIDEVEGILNQHVEEIPLALRAMPSKDKLTAQRFSDDFPVIMHARPQFTCWPSIREFTIELGADKIDEYLSSFSTNEEWLYIIYYLGLKTDKSSKFYEYEVSFVFEGHQFRHTPGLIDFCEDWLNYILDSKIGVFTKIKF